jgi:anti-sigma-K factor RskA
MSERHPDRDLLPAYSLGILDEKEKDSVRSHLAACRECRAELAAFRDVTGRLSAAIPPRDPPAGLGDRLMERISASDAAMKTHAQPHAKEHGTSSRFPWPVLTGVAAMLAVALGVGNLLQWTGVLAARSQVSQPRLTTALLSGSGDARSAYGTIVLDPNDNEGVLAVTGLPGLTPGHQYQLWLIRDGERRSGGVFNADKDVYGSMILTVPRDFKDFRSFGVSAEPSGGSALPTGQMILSGTL